MNPADESLFTSLGGKFAGSYGQFAEKLASVKALVFDWDGVFNRGEKSGAGHSGFSESDSMGVNMLRFGFWLRDQGNLPFAAIISGAQNDMAAWYAGREHFDAVLTGIKQKDEALLGLQKQYGLLPAQTAFFFDDIIDLKAATHCGLKIYFPHPATPLTNRFVAGNQLYDYMPGSLSGNLALREVCELMLHSMGLFEEVVRLRMQFSGKYEEYLIRRNAVTLK